ncbi:ABC transporter ATP-binding protein [Paenibacillus sp. YPG26]|uniref:ABC transporter ATP-binding protein n=1 Tax=Paenibacillus sp. YPG26 TaxID=2878915 RepID=UPI00203D083C|nr:ABC transporter ATP-binding protein [Paenibacillus sp. YPG26]USB31793.1 ABC transporter ATP-binding protein [Paenibacillus sp. YPG26]
MNTILKTVNLGKRYGNARGIQQIDLELQAGDIYGLLGPNGAGKTTFLKAVTGLIRYDQGTVSMFGEDGGVGNAKTLEQVGCMIESADFYEYLSAKQYLGSVARFHPHVTARRIDELLEFTGLANVCNNKIKSFSTGMKQKLALAAAVLPEPKFVILDEPTNGLDIEGVVMFRKLIQMMSYEKKTTFLISSHMIHELEQLCNRVGVVVQGRLIKEGYVTDLLTENQSLEAFYIGQLQQEPKGAIQHA